MADQLLIYLHDNQTLDADWVFIQPNGEASSVIESGTLSELAEKNKNALADASYINCIINAELVSYSEINIPAKNRQRALQAIPFALEDQLAEDIDQLHFAIGKASDNSYPVISIAHHSLKDLLEKCQPAGINIDAMYVDILSLPDNTQSENNWTVLQSNSKASILTTDGDLINADSDSLPVFFASLIQQKVENLPDTVNYYHEDNSEAEELALAEEVSLKKICYKQTPLMLFSSQLSNPSMLNILQGSYQVTRESNQWWRPWKTAAIIAAVALGLHIISGGINLNQLQQENKLIEKEITHIYKKSFPRSKKIVNARVQMENKLKQLKKSSGKTDYSFSDILLDTAPLIKQTAGVEMQGISYHNRKLELQLTLDKLSTAEALKNKLNKLSRVKAELLSASSEAKQVNARIRLESL